MLGEVRLRDKDTPLPFVVVAAYEAEVGEGLAFGDEMERDFVVMIGNPLGW